MHTVILTVLTIKILNFYESTMLAVAFSQKNRKTAIYTDIHHPTPSVLSNKTASIVKQNWNQSLRCKSHRSKTANNKILSANSKHRCQ